MHGTGQDARSRTAEITAAPPMHAGDARTAGTAGTAGAAVAVALVAVAVYWRTAYPTITWWDSSAYSLGAATLGLHAAPGSLLLTLLGWPIAQAAGAASTAHALNLLAGVLAALTVVAVYATAARTLGAATGTVGEFRRDAASVGVALGAITFAFTTTLWTYAVMFTPYILSALFTAIMLWTLVRWWQAADAPSAWRWIGLFGLELGLDFSVHRTNALIVPGAVVWILLRRPRTFRSPRAIAAAWGGLLAGLAVQLLVIPIAAYGRSPLDFVHPSTLSSFWDYESLSQMGGSFLLNVFPRKAPWWNTQSTDVLRVLGANFLHWGGPLRIAGLLPAAAIAGGLAWLWRRNRRLTMAFAALALLQSASTILYFNIPADYFRTLDRHYLPICVTLAVPMACGLGALAATLGRHLRGRSWPLALAAAALLGCFPMSQAAENWRAHDASRRTFTHDYALNALRQLPPHAIYFTVGDNDTFPVMYAQSVEGVRPDVTIINSSVANIPDWPERLARRDPSLRLSLSEAQRMALTRRRWSDTLVTLAVRGTAASAMSAARAPLPDSIVLRVQPASGSTMLPAEVLLLDIVRTNQWRRPLTFAVTGTEHAMEWLAPYGRLDGLYFRVLPIASPPTDAAILRANVLDNVTYAAYADPSVAIDDVSRNIGLMPYAGMAALLGDESTPQALAQCRADRAAFLKRLPPARLDPPAAFLDPIATACGGSASR